MSTDKPNKQYVEPKQTRIRKAKFTDQDVRIQAIEARDELLAQVDFLIDAIREDRVKLQRYKEYFGDLRYRPVISGPDAVEPVYGNPTEVNLVPLASEYRATINSLLQSIRLIQSEILPEDNPEGGSTLPSSGPNTRREHLRESFEAGVKGHRAPPTPIKDTESQPTEEQSEDDSTELAENPKTPTRTHISPVEQTSPSSEPKSTPRPWRDTTPKAQKLQDVVKEPKRYKEAVAEERSEERSEAPIEPKLIEPITLQNPEKLDSATERLRQDFMALKGNRLSQLQAKYGKKED